MICTRTCDSGPGSVRTAILVILLGVLVSEALVGAHHSEAAEYDSTKPIKVTGTLKAVEWSNPHVWFFVDVKDESGAVTTWGFSTQPPGALMRRGVTKEAMKIGAVVNVEGNRARDGSNNASTRRFTFADGKDVLASPPAGGGQ
jgi:hypothetical protein